MSTRLGWNIRCFVMLMVTLASIAQADPYPWIQMSEDDIKVIDNPKVEYSFQIEMVRAAKKTIDLVIYDQRWDAQVAFPLLQELRKAADRGVAIRFLTTWIPTITMDTQQKAPRFLTDPPTRTPIQYLIFGGPNMKSKHWLWTDCMHSKLMLVDQSILLHTGRGYSDVYLNWLDTAFVMKGGLVEQSTIAFKTMWEDAQSETPLYSHLDTIAKRFSHPADDFLKVPIGLTLSDREHQEVRQLQHWMHQPTSCNSQFCPKAFRARTLHHDLIRKLKGLQSSWSVERFRDYDERIKVLKDPVIEAVIQRLETEKEIRFNTLSTLFSPQLKESVFRALKRGAKIEIFTNGKEAQKVVAVAPFPWAAGLSDLLELINHQATVYIFEARSYLPFNYLHRKIFIAGNTVITGSHNLNLPSSVSSDEVSFEFESPSLAELMTKLQMEGIHSYGQLAERKVIQEEERSFGMNFIRWISQPFMGLF